MEESRRFPTQVTGVSSAAGRGEGHAIRGEYPSRDVEFGGINVHLVRGRKKKRVRISKWRNRRKKGPEKRSGKRNMEASSRMAGRKDRNKKHEAQTALGFWDLS